MGAKKGLIFGAAPCDSWDFLAAYRAWPDLVIGADGGLESARAAGFSPDVYVGDGDSGGCPEPGLLSIPLLPEKDLTDLQAAYEYARSQGVTELIFTGCTGGRLDHFLSALGLLERAAGDGVHAVLLAPDNRVEFFPAGIYTRTSHGFPYFSLIPVSETLRSVTITGAKYPLKDRAVARGDSLTVSNEFKEQTVTISFSDGCCYFIQSQ